MGQLLEREISAIPTIPPDARGMGRGGSNETAPLGLRTPEEYAEIWQQFFESALAAGRATNSARAIANEKLTRQRAEDEGRQLLGRGDIETYF